MNIYTYQNYPKILQYFTLMIKTAITLTYFIIFIIKLKPSSICICIFNLKIYYYTIIFS